MALLRLSPTSNVAGTVGGFGFIDDPWNIPDDLDFVGAGSTVVLASGLYGLSDLPASTPMVINSVTVYLRHYNPTPGGAPVAGRNFRTWMRTGGVDFYGTSNPFTGDQATAYYTKAYTTNPNTGLTWTTAEVNALAAGFDEPTWNPGPGGPGGDPRYTQLYVQVDYTPKADQIEQERETFSRRLLMRERGRALVEIDASALFLDAEIGSIIWLSDPTYVDSTGAELGTHTWERRPLRVLSVEADPTTFRVKLMCRDLRDGIQLRRLWDTMVADNAGPFAEGVARLGCGGVRTYARASRAYVQDRADLLIREVEQAFEPFDRYGELIESSRSNLILNSAFASGTTSWTFTNATLDATRLYWDSTLTPNSARLAPTGAAQAFVQTAAYGAALSGKRTFSTALTNENSAGVGVVIVRSGGGNIYWNAGTQLWQAGFIANTLTTTIGTYVGQSRLALTYDLGAGAFNVTAAVITLSNSILNLASVYDVQDEAGTWSTSNILTTTASVTRAAASLSITQPTSGKACWPASHGTAYIEVTPEWSAASRATGVGIVFYLAYDGNNSVVVQWNGASARWEFILKVAGVSTTAFKAATPVRGTKTKILVQWTGTDAELGLAAYTQRIYVDGVAGTDAVAAAMPTTVYTSTLYIGSDSTPANHIDAVLSALIVTDFVSPAAEVARYPLP